MARFALLRKDKQQAGTAPSVSDLEAVLSELETESAEAAAAIEKLEARRTEVLLHESDEAAKKHDEHTADLRRRLDRANARIEALRVEIEDRKAEEAQRAKREQRAEVEKKVEAARKVLATYEQHALAIVTIIKAVAESDAAIEQFQRAHPDDAPLAGAEQMRAKPGVPEKVLRTERVDLWTYTETGEVVPEERLHNLRPDGPCAGSIYSPAGHPSAVTRRPFERVTLTPAVPAQRVERLAAEIQLPSFRAGERPFWQPVSSPYASQVLQAIERRATARDAERQAETILRPIQDERK
jgi:hypothetical protein